VNARKNVAVFWLPRGLQIAVAALMLVNCVWLLSFAWRGIPKPILDTLDPQMFAEVQETEFRVRAWALGSTLVTAVMAALLTRMCTVQVRPDGIKLSSLWWLPWGDVCEARYFKLLGLPYFYVKRFRRWFGWWIPLYFVGDRDLAQAIVDAAPSGHPFRLVPMPRRADVSISDK
jgi:hypothetical protein